MPRARCTPLIIGQAMTRTQRIDRMSPPSGYTSWVGPSATSSEHCRSAQTHENGLSEPSTWSCPGSKCCEVERYRPIPRTATSYNPTGSPSSYRPSPYFSGPDSVTYTGLDIPPSHSRWPPQPTRVCGTFSGHLLPDLSSRNLVLQAFPQQVAFQALHTPSVHTCTLDERKLSL